MFLQLFAYECGSMTIIQWLRQKLLRRYLRSNPIGLEGLDLLLGYYHDHQILYACIPSFDDILRA